MSLPLEGRTCIVTGAGIGLGSAIAINMSKKGCNVLVNYYSHKDEAEETARKIEDNNRRALVVKADVSKKVDVELMARNALDSFGTVDILVNNAGMFMVKPSLDLTEAEWQRTIDVNLKSTFLCSQAIGKIMIARRRGVIVNMSSVAGLSSFPERAAYCAAKAGVIALTKSLAVEWAQYNVRVNAIAPAYIETEEMKEEVKKGILDTFSLTRRTPMKRFGDPNEVANVVAFLASDDASYITGETVNIDGGWLAYGFV